NQNSGKNKSEDTEKRVGGLNAQLEMKPDRTTTNLNMYLRKGGFLCGAFTESWSMASAIMLDLDTHWLLH
ncbi:hypothetical protein CEXT_311261, partial [Caerostris extrusa]